MMNFPVTTLEMVEKEEAVSAVMSPYLNKRWEETKRLTEEAYSQLLSCLGDNYQNPRISEMSIEEVLELPYAPEWVPGAKKKLTQIWKDEETIKREKAIRQLHVQYWKMHKEEMIGKIDGKEQDRLYKYLEDNYQMPGILNMSVEEGMKRVKAQEKMKNEQR